MHCCRHLHQLPHGLREYRLPQVAVDALLQVWFEFVDSIANQADPLSRAGYRDPAVQRHLATGVWRAARFPDDVNWHQLFSADLRVLGEAPRAALGRLQTAITRTMQHPDNQYAQRGSCS